MILLSLSIHSTDIDWPAWIQAIVSSIAFIGVVITLILQLKYTRAQLEISKRDYNRYIREIRPVLLLEQKKSQNLEGLINLTFKNNPGLNITMKNKCDKCITLKGFTEETISQVNTDFVTKFGYTINEQLAIVERGSLNEIMFAFDFNFEDIEGNHYSQGIWKSNYYNHFMHEIPVFKGVNTSKI